MQIRDITIKGIKTRVREQGEGTVLLILHGWGVSSQQWQETIGALGRISMRIVVPDLPGFGETAEPPQTWSISDYTDWCRVLIAELKAENFFLLGHSFGGRIAIKLASTEVSGLQKLILCASAGLRPSNFKSRIKRNIFAGVAKAGRVVLGAGFFNSQESRARELLYKVVGEHDYEKTSGVMREVFKKAVSEDLTDDLSKIEVPCLLIWGSEDDFTPLRDGRKMASLVPNSRLEVIEGGKHNAYRTHIQEFTALVSDFVRSDNDVKQ